MDREWYSRLPERFANFREGDLSATNERKRAVVETSFPPRMGHGAQLLRALRLPRRREITLDRQRPKASVEPAYPSSDQERGHRAIFLQAARSTRSVGAKVVRAGTWLSSLLHPMHTLDTEGPSRDGNFVS